MTKNEGSMTEAKGVLRSIVIEKIEISSPRSSPITIYKRPNEEHQLPKSEEDQINEIMELLKLDGKSHRESNFHPTFQINVPSNLVPFGCKIKRGEISSFMKIGSELNIWFTEVHNPTKFWFHLADHLENFNSLMKDMAQCYSNNANDYQIKTANIRIGQICAARFLGIWHRGKIVSGLMEGAKVKVCFIDYGTTATVEVNYIKYLLKSFANLPSQVYRGALADIKPLNSHRWSRDSTCFMLNLVMDIVVQARVFDIDYENRMISLFLSNTNNNIYVDISNELIINGYAMAEDQESLSEANKKTSIFYKMYPTFEMLEKGEYPSFYEIGLYLADGFDLYKFEDKTIIPGIDALPVLRKVNKNCDKLSLNPFSLSWYPPD